MKEDFGCTNVNLSFMCGRSDMNLSSNLSCIWWKNLSLVLVNMIYILWEWMLWLSFGY